MTEVVNVKIEGNVVPVSLDGSTAEEVLATIKATLVQNDAITASAKPVMVGDHYEFQEQHGTAGL